jgi:hypothetical protein
MKLTKTMLVILLSTVVGNTDIITLQWKPSPDMQKKYVTIPAGKVCKVLTVSQHIYVGYVDAAGGEILVYDDRIYVTSENSITIAGPVKIFFKKQVSVGSFITLDIVDQNTPKSGVTFTDN